MPDSFEICDLDGNAQIYYTIPNNTIPQCLLERLTPGFCLDSARLKDQGIDAKPIHNYVGHEWSIHDVRSGTSTFFQSGSIPAICHGWGIPSGATHHGGKVSLSDREIRQIWVDLQKSISDYLDLDGNEPS